MSQFIMELDSKRSITDIGGKAYALTILNKSGFNIPKGFIVLSSVFLNYLKENNLVSKIEMLASKLAGDNTPELSQEIRSFILEGEITPDVKREIDEHLQSLNGEEVSVRSSAVSEDGQNASFAGLFDTSLGIATDLIPVLENIKRCWASFYSERAISYRLRKGLLHLEGVAVIIQEMVPAEFSGVTFTTHPFIEGSWLIETSYGLGDLLVSGRINPDSFTGDRESFALKNRTIGNKNMMHVYRDGEAITVATDEESTRKQAISDEKVVEIAKLCQSVEDVFGLPQDIEWCIYNEKIWLLQSRPITGGLL